MFSPVASESIGSTKDILPRELKTLDEIFVVLVSVGDDELMELDREDGGVRAKEAVGSDAEKAPSSIAQVYSGRS